MNYSIKHMTIVAFSAALISVLAQITIPLPLIPLTLQTFAIGLVASILSKRQAVEATVLYIIMGAIGLPVFASFTSGIGILLGPKGGFLLSFPLMAYLISAYRQLFPSSIIHLISANLIGMLINLFVGTAWLKWMLKMDWQAAFMSGFVPFLIIGVVKGVAAAMIGNVLYKRMKQAKLITVE